MCCFKIKLYQKNVLLISYSTSSFLHCVCWNVITISLPRPIHRVEIKISFKYLWPRVAEHWRVPISIILCYTDRNSPMLRNFRHTHTSILTLTRLGLATRFGPTLPKWLKNKRLFSYFVLCFLLKHLNPCISNSASLLQSIFQVSYLVLQWGGHPKILPCLSSSEKFRP